MVRKILRRAVTIAAAAASSLSLVAVTALPADAGGTGYSPAPGASYNSTTWYTKSKSNTTETLHVAASGVTVGKANSCNYGTSIWYTDYKGVRRNIYMVRTGCTWGPYWYFNSPYFTAKRGTTVQVTYRWDGTWYPGLTFKIK